MDLTAENLPNDDDIREDKSKPELAGKTRGAEYNDVVRGRHW